MRGPNGRPIFRDRALNALEEQTMTETFLGDNATFTEVDGFCVNEDEEREED